MKKVLILLTRDPFGRATGRKTVLKTIMSVCEELGYDVDGIVFNRRDSDTGNRKLVYLGMPGKMRVLWNVVTKFFLGKLSLNECAYYSPALRRRLRRLVEFGEYDVVICDMIRLCPYADTLGKPWVLDLDDLLSDRYMNRMNSGLKADGILGYLADRIPKSLEPIVRKVLPMLLLRESRVLREREVYYGRKASAVSLVSPLEGHKLEERTGNKAHVLPMAIRIPDDILYKPELVSEKARTAVFLGGMDYQPNLDAVQFFIDEIYPTFEEDGIPDFILDVVGYCPEKVSRKFEGKPVRFLGYAEDVYAVMAKYPIFLAPIVSGTGIKTKVLEAMAVGMPIVASEAAVFGLDIKSGLHCMVVEHPSMYARTTRALLDDVEMRRRLSINAYRFVSENFSSQILKEKWQAVFLDVLSK